MEREAKYACHLPREWRISRAVMHSFALLLSFRCVKSWETTRLLAIVDGLNDDFMRSFTWSSIEYLHLTVSLTWVCPSTNVAATERSILSSLNVRFFWWYCPLPEGAKKNHKTKQITSCSVLQHPNLKRRRESTLNTGRFPKRAPKAQVSRAGGPGACSRGKSFGFQVPKVPFQGFWAIQTGYLLTV